MKLCSWVHQEMRHALAILRIRRKGTSVSVTGDRDPVASVPKGRVQQYREKIGRRFERLRRADERQRNRDVRQIRRTMQAAGATPKEIQAELIRACLIPDCRIGKAKAAIGR